MKTDEEALSTSLGLFRDDGAIVSSNFQDFLGDVHVGAVLPMTDQRLASLRNHLYDANQDFWNISVLIHRLEWIRAQRIELGESLDYLWMQYTQLDIQTFHVEIRSLFDHLAAAIAVVGAKPKTMPMSFREQLEWCEKHPDRALRALLREQKDWFKDLRTIRDQLVHRGNVPIVFGRPSEGILFQIYRPNRAPYVMRPGIMHNENVAYFDRYAALIISRLLCFAEDLAAVLRDITELRVHCGCVSSSAPGHLIIKTWMENLRATSTELNDSATPAQPVPTGCP